MVLEGCVSGSFGLTPHLLQRLLGSVSDARVGAGQCLSTLHFSLRRLALAHENQAQPEVGFQVTGVELSASPEFLSSLFKLLLCPQQIPQIAMRIGESRLQADNLAVLLGCLIALTLRHQDVTQIIVCLRIIGVEPCGLA